jgi:hypothetical protein
MVDETQEAGLVAVIVERLEIQLLPRTLDLKDKVDMGEALDELDIIFLEKMFADITEFKPFLMHDPENQELAERVMNLYHAITTKALENEPKGA